MPHVDFCVPATQSVEVQQPAQVVGSHSQRPCRQRCPVEQARPPPHAHSPVVALHPSERGSWHDEHARPSVPQVEVDEARQVVPSQQPMGHVEAPQVAVVTHVPLVSHDAPAPHELHAPPPLPQAEFERPPRHTPA